MLEDVSKVRLKIKEISEEKGIKNPHILASKTTLGYAICYRLWHTDQQRIDMNTVALLCDALNVKPGELFEQIEQEDSK